MQRSSSSLQISASASVIASSFPSSQRRIQRTPQSQPLEETDYYLANKLASAAGEQVLDQDAVVERMSQDSVVKALSEISPQFRDVVVLVDIGDFTYADAAQILDIPIGTVMSRLHRGRRALKQKLAEEVMREAIRPLGYEDEEHGPVRAVHFSSFIIQ